MKEEPIPSAYAGAYDANIANDQAGKAKEQVKAAATQAATKAKEVYGEARTFADTQLVRGRELVVEKPYAAIGAAMLAGLFIGLAMAAGRPQVVYLKDR